MSATESRAQSIVAPSIQNISVAGDGSVFAVAADGRVLRNDTHAVPWTQIPGPRGATAIAVSTAAGICVVVADGQPYSRDVMDGGDWESLPNAPVPLVSVSISCQDQADYTVWAIDSKSQLCRFDFAKQAWEYVEQSAQRVVGTDDGSLYRLYEGKVFSSADGSSWTALAEPPTLDPFTDIGAGATDYVWAVGGKTGLVYQYDAESWIKIPPPGTGGGRVSVGIDATVWLLQQSKIYASDDSTTGWSEVAWTSTAAPAAIAVNRADQTWALDATGAVWQFTEHVDAWQQIAPSEDKLTQVSAVDAGELWAVGQGFVYRLREHEDDWRPEVVGQVGLFNAVSAASDGTVWATDPAGAPWSFAGGAWQRVGESSTEPDRLSEVAVASSTQIVAIDRTGTVCQVAGFGVWATLPRPGTQVVDVTITPEGTILAVTDDGKLHLYLGESQWIPTSSDVKKVSAATADDVWVVNSKGEAIHLSAGAGGDLERLTVNAGLEPRWDTERPFLERRNTHLWIVDRAAQLAKNQGAQGQKVHELVKPDAPPLQDPFRTWLCMGLYDADWKPEYNNPKLGVTTYKSHFYDPDTETNWLKERRPTAVTEGARFFELAVRKYHEGHTIGYDGAAYALGLSLHYFTDLTQPMHAANYTWLSSSPIWGYHSAFEEYIMECQYNVSPPSKYVKSPVAGTNAAPFLISAAKQSKQKYFGRIVKPGDTYWYFSSDYEKRAKENVNAILTDAIQLTAQYMVVWAARLGS